MGKQETAVTGSSHDNDDGPLAHEYGPLWHSLTVAPLTDNSPSWGFIYKLGLRLDPTASKGGNNMAKCSKGFEIQVLQSGAGFYLGTIDDWEPNCRCSVEYYATREAAETALHTGWTIRQCVENQFCSGGRCF